MLKYWKEGVVAFALALAVFTGHSAHAANKTPLASYPGQPNQPIKAGDTLQAPAPTSANASINLPHGTAPTSPNNGDCWTTMSGLYCRINGTTVGPLGSGGGSPGGTSGQIQYNNAGSFGGFTLSGDCTVTVSTGVQICTKTNGVAFGYYATGTDAANLTGTVSVNRFNSGTGASSSTYLRGDGTWQSVTAALPSIASGHVLGNGTGSTATAADSTLTSILDQAFGSTQGAILYRGASSWTMLTPGVSGQVLQTNGSSANPSWVTPTGGSVGSAALVKITEVVTSGSQSSVTLSSIPQTYRNIRLVVTGRSTVSSTNSDIYMQINSDTGANYDYEEMIVNNNGLPSGGFVAQTSADIGWLVGATGPANLRSGADIMLQDYTSTSFFKHYSAAVQYLRRGTATSDSFGGAFVGDWRSTSAITDIKLFPSSGNFVDGTVVTLYGVV